MLYFYGDSHAIFSFKGLNIQHINRYEPSITMFRIGRDNIIINYVHTVHDNNSVICIGYGEVDCRCHIQRQINLGHSEDNVINSLVNNYFKTIRNNVRIYKAVIIIGIIPPTRQLEYESIHGPIRHEFPFVGSDEDRVRFTNKMNARIKTHCEEAGYKYFNPYEYYTREDGTLKYELSDQCVHIGNTTHVLEAFTELYNSIMN